MSKSRDWEGVCDGGDTGTKTTKEKKKDTTEICLGSESPSRRETLQLTGIEKKIITSNKESF